ncbi:hypothetical protein RclHR1_16720005 [Rhizophagus clarus]|uniref:Protein kinase domain-containing protein n=1 Tax=Rhizophagus clarus TaxID=94130 RepID=A0A2Z6QI81_9GLOM|nr:hypothetical protein RclHR1_16720005 [Rhizophagus clarus]
MNKGVRCLDIPSTTFHKEPDKSMENTNDSLKQAIEEGHVKFHAYNEFSDIEVIEKGSLGVVYKATWNDHGMIVALKSKFIKKEGNSKIDTQLLDKFINDLKLHKKVEHHPNILQFHGISQEPNLNKHLLVTDYADGGTLSHYLSKNFASLSWTDKLNLAKQLASGVACLHKEKIIHRNLNSSNILIREGVIKISNFGPSKQSSDISKSSSDLKGHIAYIEPRSIKNPQYRRNDKSDVYSVGVLLWELSSGKLPFKSASLTSLSQLELANKISIGQRERPIKGTPQAYIDIYSQCWDSFPNQRPNIFQVLEKLNGITLEKSIREKILEKSISEKKVKSNDNTTQKRRIADRKSIASISDISSDLLKTMNQKNNNSVRKSIHSISISSLNHDFNSNSYSLKSPKLPNSRRSSFNSINSPPSSPITLTQNRKIIENTDKAFFEEILKFFEEILEISGDTNTMIQSIKEYLHNRMREHKSTFKLLLKHRDDLKFCCLIGFFFENAIGIAQDKQEAFNHYKKSSDSNDSIGQYFLGRCYYWGYGIKQDRKKAFELLKKSSDSGNSRGQWMLGYCYERGYGTTKNLQNAFDQFLGSAEAGNVTSQMDLGRCYEDGIGVKKNIPKAIECYEKASKGGLAIAQKKLDNLLKQQRKLQNAIKKQPSQQPQHLQQLQSTVNAI